LTAVAADDLSAFRADQARIEVLMSCRGPRLLWFPRPADRDLAERAGVEWTKDLGDPEFTKNLRTLHQLTVSAQRLGVSGLAERIALARDRPLTLESLLAHRFDVERLLVEVGDEKYLRWRAAALYDEGEGTYVRWRDLFTQPPPLLVEDAEGDRVETTRLMLERLLAAKEAQDLALRARRELKARVAWLILPLILVATCVFGAGLAIVENDVETVLLAAAAGLAGSALGGLLQLRDEVTRGAQVREFTPFYAGQLLVGATAGLLVYAADRSGVVELVGGSAGVATLAFAVGFSEAAFVRLLARVGGGEQPKADAT
jgi:hypothetical protein